MRVLVIEDEVISVEGTEKGAVSAAARVRPDLILVDEHLRVGSGQGAVEQILRERFIPHVWMSGDRDRPTHVTAGVAVLRKPFTEQALGLAIAQVCARTPPVAPAG